MVAIEEGDQENQKWMSKYAAASCVAASMISVIYGYDTGVMSGAMLFIKEDLHTSEVQLEVLAGILNICALVGALAAGRTSDYIGRRYTIVLASVIFMLGSIFMGWAPNYAILMTGRCVAGVGVGYALMIAPVYTAEIASPRSRGFLASLPEFCISLGILLGYIANYYFAKLPLKLGWRLMLGIAAIPSLFLALGIMKMPESPRWLVLQGRLGDAKRVLLEVATSKKEAEDRLRDIKIAVGVDKNCNEERIKLAQKNRGEGVWKEILRPTPTVRRIIIIGVGIHFFEHATGIGAVVLYSPRIFKKAGVATKDKLLLATIGVGLIKTTVLLLSTYLIDRIGRRRLLLTSMTGIIVALSALGFGLTMVDYSKVKLEWALVLSIVSTYLFVAFFSLGLAPVTWVYSSEIWPLKLRAQGMSIGVAVNRLTNATVSMTFISIYEAITIGGAFFMFASIAVVATVFFYYFLPETVGKNLEEMEAVFRKSKDSSSKVGKEIQPGSNV